MSDLDFELDINKYSPKELEELLTLKFPYEREEIRENIIQLKAKIAKDKNLEEKRQKEIVTFLNEVDNKLNKILLERKNRMKENVITQFGGNFVIDRNSQREKNPDGRPPILTINPYRTGIGDDVSMLTGWDSGTTTHLLSIDSRFRNQYFKTTSTNFLIDLPLSLTNVVVMELVSLEIPATYFAINKRLGNNYFHIYDETEHLSGNPCLWRIAIPDGNYTREQIQNEINLMFQASTIPTPGGGSPFQPEISIDIKSGRSIISLGGVAPPATTGRSMYFNLGQRLAENAPITLPIGGGAPGGTNSTILFDAQPIQTKLGWILGYRQAMYMWSAGTLSTFPSEGIYDGWGTRYFYFVVDDFVKNNVAGIDAVLNTSVISDNILARLTRSAAGSALNLGFTLDTGSVLSDDSTRKRIYFGPVNIKKLRIKILDPYGRVVDLNNMDISFALKFQRLYD